MRLKSNIAISESGFVFNAERGDSFSTNPLGVFILRGLQEGKSPAQIEEAIIRTYEVDAVTCDKDVYDFLKMLAQFNLIEHA